MTTFRENTAQAAPARKLTLAEILEIFAAGQLPLKFSAYDGSTAGPDDAELGLDLLTPRGTTVELNSDTYIEPEPKTRAETYEIYQRMGVLSIDEIRELERFRLATFSEGIPR